MGRAEKYNWNEASEVIREAIEKGCSVRLVEKCMIYSAFKKGQSLDGFPSSIYHFFNNPKLVFGCHDHHVIGFPTLIIPFTCFDLPVSQKEKLLLNDITFCVFLDLNSLSQIFEESGFQCKILKGSERGFLQVSEIKGDEAWTIGYPMTSRLIFECLSVKTLIDFEKESLQRLKKGEFEQS